MNKSNWSALLALALLTGCDKGSSSAPPSGAKPPALPPRFTQAELKDPKNCRGCHERQYNEWASSMHAYAATDPVFRAMNKRGQRETQGKLGSFCVQCHAPMAFREGLSEDGLNLDEVPEWAQGVTCFFCHNANGVGEEHFNGNVTLAYDDVMRGGFDGVDPGRHGTAKSEFHDRDSPKSALLCGTCHDVVNDRNVHIERTYQEYLEGVSSLDRFPVAQGGDSCQGCHMRWTTTDYVANNSPLALKKRDLHDHRSPAVDIAITENFPGSEEHARATRCAISESAYILSITADELGRFSIAIETDAGHDQPSGTAQDRRMWLEFVAYDKDDKVIFESGTIGDGEIEELPDDERPNRQQLCMFRDHLVDDDDHEVHMFWEATKDPKQHPKRRILPVATRQFSTHEAYCRYQIPKNQRPARVEMVMKMRPIGVDILQSLVDSDDLDPAVIAKMPTFTLHRTHVVWRPEDGNIVEKPTPLESSPDCD